MKVNHPLRLITLGVLAVYIGWETHLFAQRPSSPPADTSHQVGTTPTLFAEGRLSTGDFESHPEFTPDGKTLYFVKSNPQFTYWTIYVSHLRKGQWSKPEIAPFSGKYRDADPFITRDGAHFYFISDRPVDGKPKEDMDIWYMERTRQGWGAPKNVGAPINTAASEWFPTVAANGTLYFGSDRPGGNGLTDLYRSRWVGGKFAEPENLGTAINTEHQEYEPYIAPDESYLIFMAIRPDGLGGGDLFISHNRNGTWTRAQNLGDPINTKALEISPKVSPDGKSFFWASSRRAKPAEPGEKRPDTPRNGLGDLYRIDITALPIGKEKPLP
jgi:Tol biopolymer transport system component